MINFLRTTVIAVIASVAMAIAFNTGIGAQDRRVIVGNQTWTSGGGAPSATASAGDLYTRTDTGQVYIYDGSAWMTYHALGVGQGYKIARGTITLDGTNPSSATTGLTAISSCTVSQKRNDTPGDDPTAFTTYTSAVAGRLDVYAWKNTAGTDPTLVASTDSDDVIDWICIGT